MQGLLLHSPYAIIQVSHLHIKSLGKPFEANTSCKYTHLAPSLPLPGFRESPRRFSTKHHRLFTIGESFPENITIYTFSRAPKQNYATQQSIQIPSRSTEHLLPKFPLNPPKKNLLQHKNASTQQKSNEKIHLPLVHLHKQNTLLHTYLFFLSASTRNQQPWLQTKTRKLSKSTREPAQVENRKREKEQSKQ